MGAISRREFLGSAAGALGLVAGVNLLRRGAEDFVSQAQAAPSTPGVVSEPNQGVPKDAQNLPKNDSVAALYPAIDGRTPFQQPEAFAGRGGTILVENFSDAVTITPGALANVSSFFEKMAANQVPGRDSAQIRVDGELVPINLRLNVAPNKKTAILVVPDTDLFPSLGDHDSIMSRSPSQINEPNVVVIRVPGAESQLLRESAGGVDASALLVNRAMVQAVFDATVDVKTKSPLHTQVARDVMGKTLAVAMSSRATYGNAPAYGDSSSGFQKYLQEVAAADTHPSPTSDTVIKLSESVYNGLSTGVPLVMTSQK